MSLSNVTDEPYRGSIGDLRLFQSSGFEAIRRLISGDLPGFPPSRLFGSRLTDVGLGTVSAAMPVTPWLEDSHRLIEAGIFALFADAPLAAALWSGLPPGRVSTTSEINMSFVRPTSHSTTNLVGRAETIHLGRQVGLSSIHITDQTGRLLAHGTTKCLISDVPVDLDAEYPPPDTGPDDPPDPYLRPPPGPEAYWTARDLIEGAPLELMERTERENLRFPIWSLTGYEPD
ncbi:MAG: PaaI family thioesterase, partial [Acidimicrobiia bacterium]|nr:PaaI family thioesterase [Acidimicrobiia bacterium]